jgi:hypothetical protein
MSQLLMIKCDNCGLTKKANTDSMPPVVIDGWGQIKIEFDRMKVEWVDACPECVAIACKLLEDFKQ